MTKHGVIEDGRLVVVPPGAKGAKRVICAEIPDFDQEMEAVFEAAPVDMGDYILLDVEIREVEQDEEEQYDEMF
jgi:hypothetical protein